LKSIIIIPARYNSSRLPGKLLLNQSGKFLIQHAYEKALNSNADKVIVATDDLRIKEVVENFGGTAVLTNRSHLTGSDRIAEAAKMFPEYEIIVNLQGDEPEIDPKSIDMLIEIHSKYKPFATTLCYGFSPLTHPNFTLPSCVKVALGQEVSSLNYKVQKALYFSRALIPYHRENNQTSNLNKYFMHLGVYAYSQQTLAKFVELKHGTLEQIEALEQLRILEHGHEILCAQIDKAHAGIDTLEEYEEFVKRSFSP
jgi:3-deoxy-manno-octulosonate cytidylyltransferase (CMP-KDO synthetase)